MTVSRGKQWVVKNNNYIEAKFTNYKPSLSQNRIVLWLASKVHSQKDDEFNVVTCNTTQLREIIGSNFTNEKLVNELALLRSATAVMQVGNQWEIFGIIDKAKLNTETKLVELKLNDDMKPFLLKLGDGNQGFTRIDLDKVQSMRSVHSQRIYELLLQYKNLSRGDSRIIKLDDLKEYLGLKQSGASEKKPEKFPRWTDFEKRVLRQAEKDLCNAGMFIHYEPLKTGRKVTSVSFTFSINKDHDGKKLEGFTSLFFADLSIYERLQITNTTPLDLIEKTIVEAEKMNSMKPLKNLIPKTRKEYHEKMSKMMEQSMKKKNRDSEELLFDLDLEESLKGTD